MYFFFAQTFINFYCYDSRRFSFFSQFTVPSVFPAQSFASSPPPYVQNKFLLILYIFMVKENARKQNNISNRIIVFVIIIIGNITHGSNGRRTEREGKWYYIKYKHIDIKCKWYRSSTIWSRQTCRIQVSIDEWIRCSFSKMSVVIKSGGCMHWYIIIIIIISIFSSFFMSRVCITIGFILLIHLKFYHSKWTFDVIKINRKMPSRNLFRRSFMVEKFQLFNSNWAFIFLIVKNLKIALKD